MKKNNKKEILKCFQELIKLYPNQDICLHLSTILSDYSSFDTLSDKEFLFLMEKYMCEKELDFTPEHPASEIDKILYEGTHLEEISFEDADDEDF